MSTAWVIVHKDAPDTELAAAEAARHKYPKVALRVLNYLIEHDGDYDSHGADALEMWLNSYAPARNALMRKGYVQDSGRRVTNERGRTVRVWTATPSGHDAAQNGELA